MFDPNDFDAASFDVAEFIASRRTCSRRTPQQIYTRPAQFSASRQRSISRGTR